MAKATSKKTKNCKRGFNCGRSCISKAKICRSNIGADGKKIAESYAEFVKRIAAEEAAKQGQSSKPKGKPTGVSPEEAKGRLKEFAGRLNKQESDKIANDMVAKSGPSAPTQDNYVVSYLVDGRSTTVDQLVSTMKKQGDGEINSEALDLINELANGAVVNVTWDWEDNDEEREALGSKMTAKESLRVALQARRHWKDEFEGQIPVGTILSNDPIGGPGGTRASAYKRQGFGDTSPITGEQFAIVNAEGKLVPLNMGILDPSIDRTPAPEPVTIPDEPEEPTSNTASGLSASEEDAFNAALEAFGLGDTDDYFDSDGGGGFFDSDEDSPFI